MYIYTYTYMYTSCLRASDHLNQIQRFVTMHGRGFSFLQKVWGWSKAYFLILQCLHFSPQDVNMYIYINITWPTQLCWSAALSHRSIATFINAISRDFQSQFNTHLSIPWIKLQSRIFKQRFNILFVTVESTVSTWYSSVNKRIIGITKNKRKTTLYCNYKIGRVYCQINNKTYTLYKRSGSL